MPTRVLIVDDDNLIRDKLRDILTAGGMEIAGEATDGLQAMSKHHQLKPDVTLMDIVMPCMDGIKATRAILKVDPSAKIVICSSLGQESMVIDAISAGAKDYIRKPFSAVTVLETIRKVSADQG